MAYQALYRKWRPSNFDEVRGQDHIVTTLKNQIEMNRMPICFAVQEEPVRLPLPRFLPRQ